MMSENLQPNRTRVWWDDSEVNLIRWTPEMLVLAWVSNDETAFRIPRPAAIRLLRKGVLRIEGDGPDWIPDQLTVQQPGPDPAPRAVPSRPAPVAKPRPVFSRPAPVTTPRPAPALVAQPAPASPANRGDRLNAIARIIRKLTGGASSPAEAAG